MRRSIVFGRAALLALALGGVGCQWGDSSSTANPRAFPGVTLTVGAVGDPASLAAARAWKTTWERETGASLVFIDDALDPADLKTRGVDVVVFPGDRLGDLVDVTALSRLEEQEVRPPVALGDEEAPPDPLAFADLIPVFREQVSQYGDHRIGLPLGGTGLVMVYRRDLFESEANKAAAQAKGITLAAPKTWDELDALVAFLHEQTGKGIAAPLGDDPEGVGNVLLLARSTSSALHPDHYAVLFDPDSMRPRIDSPPFVEALAAMAKWKAHTPQGGESFSADDARAAFRKGEAAILIDRAETASKWTDPKKPLSVIAAALPSSSRVYEPDRKIWQDLDSPNRVAYLPRGGGLLVGITPRGSETNRKAALDLVKSLGGPETARSLLIEPSYPLLPVRNTQLSAGLPDPRSALGVDVRAWGIAVAQTLTAPRTVIGLRIPQSDEYLAAIAKARKSAMAGTAPESALAEAASTWNALTEKLGRDRQLWHYRRSLNKLITEPEPPPTAR